MSENEGTSNLESSLWCPFGFPSVSFGFPLAVLLASGVVQIRHHHAAGRKVERTAWRMKETIAILFLTMWIASADRAALVGSVKTLGNPWQRNKGSQSILRPQGAPRGGGHLFQDGAGATLAIDDYSFGVVPASERSPLEWDTPCLTS